MWQTTGPYVATNRYINGYVFPRRYKTRQLPVNPEFRTESFEFDLKKLYNSLLFLAKTQVSTKR